MTAVSQILAQTTSPAAKPNALNVLLPLLPWLVIFGAVMLILSRAARKNRQLQSDRTARETTIEGPQKPDAKDGSHRGR